MVVLVPADAGSGPGGVGLDLADGRHAVLHGLPARTRRTRSDGARSHRAILDAAARLATFEGLEGLSISRVTAEAIYAAEVIEPAMQSPEGLKRLEQLCERYLSYVERGVSRVAAASRPPPPSSTAAAGRSETASARCLRAGTSCSRPTSVRRTAASNWRRTSTSVS
ncbi:MAG TPA: hypothetical protein VFG79_02670 [Solirubrobacter sp.]|nr:hypothetical protein [Solirubrobacter sp.]